MIPWIIHFDGACQPQNPGGVASYGWTLHNSEGYLVDSGCGVVCVGTGATNNVAEYGALEAALCYLLDSGVHVPLLCKGDSMLVVNQVTGRWRCKREHLKIRRDRVLSLLKRIIPTPHRYEMRWIPRKENEGADALSRKAYRDYLHLKSRKKV